MTKKNIRRRKGQKQNRRTTKKGKFPNVKRINSERRTKKNIKRAKNRTMKGGARVTSQQKGGSAVRAGKKAKDKPSAAAKEAAQTLKKVMRAPRKKKINYNEDIFSNFKFHNCMCDAHQWLKTNKFLPRDFSIETETLRGIVPEGAVMPHYTTRMREKIGFASRLLPGFDATFTLSRMQAPPGAVIKIVNSNIDAEMRSFKQYNLFIQGKPYIKEEFQNIKAIPTDHWPDDLNWLIRQNFGICPYCGSPLDFASATGEHTHGRTLVHYLTRSLNPEKNIYCVAPMCAACNTPDNPPSVVVHNGEILILQKTVVNKKRIIEQPEFDQNDLRHQLIFRMCLYRDQVSFNLLRELAARTRTAPNDYSAVMGTVHFINLWTSIFNATTVRDSITADQLGSLLKLYNTLHRTRVNELEDELEKAIGSSTLKKSLNALEEYYELSYKTGFETGIDTGLVAAHMAQFKEVESLRQQVISSKLAEERAKRTAAEALETAAFFEKFAKHSGASILAAMGGM